jgi:uncharacterized protein (TIRG00374 family)
MAVLIIWFADFEKIGDGLSNANYVYVAPSLIFYFLAVQARTTRWRYLLRPLIGKACKPLYPVVVVGYMANNLIPVRIGELLRSYYLSLREPVSAAGAVGTVAVERASDVLALLFFLALAWAFLPTTGVFGDFVDEVPVGAPLLAAAAVLPFLGVLAVVVVITMASRETILRTLGRVLAPLPEGLRTTALRLAWSLLEGLTVVNSPKSLAIVFLYSLPVWALEAAMYYLIAMGFDLRSEFESELELIAVLLVFTAAANLAGVLPSSAGSWGAFDLFGAAALFVFGVPNNVALAFALTVHVALWVPVTVLGAVLLLADGSSLRNLMDGLKRDRDSRDNDEPAKPRPEPLL